MSKINQFPQINQIKQHKTKHSNKKSQFNEEFKLNLTKKVNAYNSQIDNINQKLENGDLNSVKELERLGISYTQEEFKGGYRINYDYNDVYYTISYNEIKSNNNFHNEKPVISRLNNESYDIIQNMIDEKNQEIFDEMMSIVPPTPPNFSNYQNEDDYNIALNKYDEDVKKYEEAIKQHNKETDVLEYLSTIISEKQRLNEFNKNINDAINDIKQNGNANNTIAINQLKEYANDFKSKVEEKIYYTQELNNCISALDKLVIPIPPTISSSKNEEDYTKELEQYQADTSKYEMEEAAIQLRLQMINKKLQILDALLENMYSSDYETSTSLFWS